MNKFYVVLGIMCVIGAAVLVYAIGFGPSGQAVSVPVDIEGLDDPAVLRQMARGASLGPEGAPLTIIEFSDFECPSCAFFALNVKPRLEEELVETGRANFVFYDFPLSFMHPNSFLASRAARCAEDQGQFWPYHDELYRRQADWAPMPDPAEVLVGFADELGMDADAFGGCLRSDRHAELISANLGFAEMLGIPGTPTVLISVKGQNPRGSPGFDYESIMATINALTESEPPLPDEGG